MLAHANPGGVIQQVRCFDVSLLFMLSGMTTALSNKHQAFSFSYLWKRINKLLFPAYIMMTLIFIGTSVVCYVAKVEYMYSLKDYIMTLLLTNEGMGYVWIVKYYLLAAVLAPMMVNRLKNASSKQVLLYGLASVAIYNICYYCYLSYVKNSLSLGMACLFDEYVFGSIAYMGVVALGVLVVQKKKSCYPIIGITALMFALTQVCAGEFGPNTYKFPPSIYYLAYSVLISLLLFKLLPNFNSTIVTWISKHSYDMYIIHIPCIVLIMILRSGSINLLPSLFNNWFFRYALIVCWTIMCTLIYSKIIEKRRNKNVSIHK